MFSSLSFNTDYGYLEGLVRGYKNGLLSTAGYNDLCQCETLEDLRIHLQGTDYGPILANEPSPLSIRTIEKKMKDKLTLEFEHIRKQAVGQLSTFLDYISYSYMIDNIILLLTGTLRHRPMNELIKKCHPLGKFEIMETIHIAETPGELYDSILVDTPLAPFFGECIYQEDFDGINIEIIRNKLHKAYLETFCQFCKELGGITDEIMGEILAFEADRRAFMITINSLGTELTKEQRFELYPTCGQLHPIGLKALGRVEEYCQVKEIADYYLDYQILFRTGEHQDENMNLEDIFYKREVELLKKSFMKQFHFGVFYAYFRLREQEIRNIIWIAECIYQNYKQGIHNYVPIF